MSGKNKMMIVDDDMITRNIARLIFEDHFEVLEAEHGARALELLNRYRQELAFIICDISMPVMDGFTFLKEKARFVYNNGIPVIIITVAGDDQIRQQAITLGAADFVEKPLTPNIVRLRVDNVLSNYGIGYAYNDALQREFLDLINNQLRGGTLCVNESEDYSIYYVSESLACYLGYEDASEMIQALKGRWINMFTSDEQRMEEFRLAEADVKSQLAKKGEFIHEYRLRKKNGDYIWVRENGKYSGIDSMVRRWVALCVDITDIKAAEEKARFNEQLASIALASTNISIWEYDYATSCIIQGHHSMEVHGSDVVVEDVPNRLVENGYVHPDSVEPFLRMYEALRNGVEKAEGIFQVQTADRTGYMYEHIHYTNTFDKSGKPYRAIGISSDVTEQRATIARYERELDFNKALSPDIFATTRLNLTQRMIEEIHTDIEAEKELLAAATFDSLPDIIKGLNGMSREASLYFASLTPDRICQYYESGKRINTFEFQRQISGKMVWVRVEMHLMKDPHNQDLLAFVYFRNIDKQYREMERLKALAEKDQMTGLYNHDTTINQIKQYLALEGAGMKHALLVIDINKFKAVNDRYGHLEGDSIITDVARRIQSVFRSDDIVGRVGGDEFMVLIKNVDSGETVKRKIRELEEMTNFLFHCSGRSIEIGCSIGMAMYTGPAMSFDELYKAADDAMYEAKHGNGSR